MFKFIQVTASASVTHILPPLLFTMFTFFILNSVMKIPVFQPVLYRYSPVLIFVTWSSVATRACQILEAISGTRQKILECLSERPYYLNVVPLIECN